MAFLRDGPKQTVRYALKEATERMEQAAVVDRAREMIAEATKAYEQARGALLHRRRQAEAEQERLHDLLDGVQALQESARCLIEKAGLAYVLETGRETFRLPDPVDAGAAEAMPSLREAHVAYVDLRERLLALATLYQAKSQFADACRMLEALAENSGLPLSEDAQSLLPGAYEAMLIGEINAGRTDQALRSIAKRLYLDPTAAAAKAAVSSVLAKALAANHHQASALAAVALAPLQAISPEQRQELTRRPECLDVVREETGCVVLSSRQFYQPVESDEYRRVAVPSLLTVSSTSKIGALIYKDMYTNFETRDHFTHDNLEVFSIPEGLKIRRCMMSRCDHPDSVTFSSTDALVQVACARDTGWTYDIDKDVQSASDEVPAGATSVAASFDREFLAHAMAMADCSDSGEVVRATATDDGLYAVVASSKGILTTLARALSPSTSL